jgi:ribonuclease Z
MTVWCAQVACVGYAFAERKKRLRPEYVGTPGRELGRLRKEGVEIEEETYAPLFVYLGDTSTQVYEAHPEVFDYPVIITECTFIPDPHEVPTSTTPHVAPNSPRLCVAHPRLVGRRMIK